MECLGLWRIAVPAARTDQFIILFSFFPAMYDSNPYREYPVLPFISRRKTVLSFFINLVFKKIIKNGIIFKRSITLRAQKRAVL